MKKIFILFALLAAVVGIWLFLSKSSQPPTSPVITSIETNQTLPQLEESNLLVVTPASNPASRPYILEPTNIVVNALTATNLEQWKSIIKDIKYSDTFYGDRDSWVMEQRDPSKAVLVLLQENGQTIPYKVRFIDADAYKDGGEIIEVQMQTPDMNIDETRELGLQLCNMLQVDPKGFLAWCDKVGNHWLDAPLFADGNRHYSFHLLRTYDNDKPWYINFMITPNP